MLLFIGGHETTTTLIGNGVFAFAAHPEQWKLLVHDSTQIALAVDEISRYDPPVHLLTRVALEDVCVRDRHVKAGDQVCLVLGSANRDPLQFDNPDRFDITRRPNRHLGFGAGIHACIGASMAQLVASVALKCLARHVVEVPVIGNHRFRDAGYTVRGLASLTAIR